MDMQSNNNLFEVINNNFKKHFQSGCNCIESLYHYTTKSALFGIMETKGIRISNVNYFDDRLELDFGIRLAIGKLKELCYRKNYDEFFFTIEHQILKFYLNKNDYYVFSTCLNKDNSYLSKNYSNQNGCIIGFEKKWLIDCNEQGLCNNGFVDTLDNKIYYNYELEYGKVIYDREKQEEIIIEYIEELYKNWRIQKSEIHTGFLALDLSVFLLMFKTEAYKYENELRLIFHKGLKIDDGKKERNNFISNDNCKYFYLGFQTTTNSFFNPIEEVTFLSADIPKAFEKMGYEKTKIDFAI